MPTITAVLITHNEGHNLADCLDSLSGLVDQIVVVDSGSGDNTVEIAKRFGAIVSSQHDWQGFGKQKNRALALATGDWVLSIDADERLTPELSAEIRKAINQPNGSSGFSVPRTSWYCGTFIRHSGWSPDYVKRIFRRGEARFSDDLVHERLLHSGPFRPLQNAMLHYSFRNFSQVLQKVDRYSTEAAEQAFSRGKRATVYSAVGHGIWAFFRTYFLRAGVLDGAYGLALAISNAEGTYYRYLKIWHMGQSQA
jgi:glycosyltransferase involved in cell wall biosynthesis